MTERHDVSLVCDAAINRSLLRFLLRPRLAADFPRSPSRFANSSRTSLAPLTPYSLRNTRRPQINNRPIRHSALHTPRPLDALLLPVLIPGELRAALEKVSVGCRCEPCEEAAGAFGGDYFAAGGEEGVACEGRVDLDSGLGGGGGVRVVESAAWEGGDGERLTLDDVDCCASVKVCRQAK